MADEHFVELKKHYSENAIIEIVSVRALLGWLNRWVQTLAPEIEDGALAFAQEHLARRARKVGMIENTSTSRAPEAT